MKPVVILICVFFAYGAFTLGFATNKTITTPPSNTLKTPSPQLGQFAPGEIRNANPPANLSIEVTGGTVTLSWTAVQNVSCYIVEASVSVNSGFSDITSFGAISYQGMTVRWSKPATDIWQFYRVRSVTGVIPNDFILVEGGTFNNGTSDVTISSFYLDSTELTQSAYQAVMGSNPASGYGVGSIFPVYLVSWFNAIEYCNKRSINEGLMPCYSYVTYGTNPANWPAGWNTSNANHTNITCNWTANGYRLPTEMEWMFAAKGGNLTHGYSYSGSNTLDEVAWYVTNSGSMTHIVGTKTANELGLLDMSGNVWEWTWDIWGTYPSGAQTNPHGASSGVDRVNRGGGWYNDASYCTVSTRVTDYATGAYNNIGFRVCKNIDNFVPVQGGTFNNGTSDVTVSSFFIDRFELTQAAYQAVMGTNPASGSGVGSSYPVYNVSWFNAIEYCNKRSISEGYTPCYIYSTYGTDPVNWPAGWNTSDANHTNLSCNFTVDGYRLLTEAEWQFAARGGNQSQGFTYSGSNTIEDVAWYITNSGSTTHNVGLKAANELGLHDMSGNLMEWNWDIYGSYPTGAQTNPQGATSGYGRCRRGGGWNSSDFASTNAFRSTMESTYNAVILGFRVCRNIGSNRVAAPVFNPPESTFSGIRNVSISCSTFGAEIHYTTDGSEPTTSSDLYQNPISINQTITFKAKAYITGLLPSLTTTAVYTYQPFPLSFVFVEGGTFNNGTSDVTVSSFYLDKYELTQSAYQSVMGTNPSASYPEYGVGSDNPVYIVSWFNAIKYCNLRSLSDGLVPCYSYFDGTYYGTNPVNWPAGWDTHTNHTNILCNWSADGYRLPTEAEWEYAARGGNQPHNYTYSGSNDINAVAWWGFGLGGNSGGTCHIVGTRAPNELGIYDLTGNVREFVWDIYDIYPTGAQNNPLGPVSGTGRVYRGGSWGNADSSCTNSFRYYTDAGSQGIYHGFRICKYVQDIVSAPLFVPGAGTYLCPQSVNILSGTSGTTVRYTTDGTIPSETAGTIYTGPITVGSDITIKAIAYRPGWPNSVVTTAVYDINLTVADPTFSPAAGSFTTAQNVTIACSTSGAQIRYTTNGSDPTQSSSLYSTPIAVSETTTIKARAFLTGWAPSAVISSVYTFTGTVATPSFNPQTGVYYSTIFINISCSTVGAQIRYTTNGNEPTESSTLYSSPLSITGNTTLRAKGFKSGWTPSDTFTAIYTIYPASFAHVAGGTFNNGTSDVTVSSFFLDRYELKQSAYVSVMGSNPSAYYWVTNGPVEQVTWYNAIEYCNKRSMNEGLTPCYSYSSYGTNPMNWPAGWNTSNENMTNVNCNWPANGYRLPTEAEWQFAARGGNLTHNYTYSGSNDINAVAWYIDNSSTTTHAVGTKAPNELGFYDMSGNVYEWCWDTAYTYPSGAQINPHGSNVGVYKLAPGGSFYSSAEHNTIVFRSYSYPLTAYSTMGLRVCRSEENSVLVEGGTFNNGSSNITLSSYYIDRFETTQAAYQAVMGTNPSGHTGVDNAPVECSSWFNAIEYCNRRSMNEGLTPCYSYSTYGTNPANWPSGWNTVEANHLNVSCDWGAFGYRLPTEMEWMYAAANDYASHGYAYSGSSDIEAVAWYSSNSSNTTHPVGYKATNNLGIHDMSGNVWEWCWDIAGTYPDTPQTNPHGPDTGTSRIIRGGSYYNPATSCTIWYRATLNNTGTYQNFGLRLCRNASSPVVAIPSFNPPEGIYLSSQTVSITCTTPGTQIRYTTDGSEPSESSTIYTNPLNIVPTTILKAKAYKAGWTPSETATAVYFLGVPEQMVLIGGGIFNNGTSDVAVSSFCIDKYELTQAGYQAVMGTNPSNSYGIGGDFPVYYVTWFNAIEYCNKRSINEGFSACYSYSTYGTNPANWPAGWNTSNANDTNVSCNWTVNGYRLPTEMEWMFAARGGNLTHNYNYSGSDTIGDVAWYTSNSSGSTHTVGTKIENELGIFDMTGNVWEWIWDIYGNYPSGFQNNPHGALSGTYRVVRGGCWFFSDFITNAYRGFVEPITSTSGGGVRVCRNAQ